MHMLRFDSYTRRGLALILIMAVVVATVASIALYVTYRAAMAQQRERLVETAQSRARFIEAVARYSARRNGMENANGVMEATLFQLRDAHSRFRGFGRSGEFTLARRENGNIRFLLSHRHFDLAHPKSLPYDALDRAQPMRAALEGRTGVMIGVDYRGVKVLAAYEPVADLQLGIVAKIDLAEVRAPFIVAGLWAAGIGALLIALGTYLFLYIGGPLVQWLTENESKLRIWENAFAFTAEGIVITDAQKADNPIVSCNPAFERITGYSAKEAVGRNCRFLQKDDAGQPEARQEIRAALAAGRDCKVELRNYRKDGSLFWNRLSISPVKDEKGRITHFIGIQDDITERMRMEEELKSLAIHDVLTGLFNRGEIERLAALEVGRSRRYRRPMALLLMDIDHFKRINDTWGHPTGDLILRRFAETLSQTIRRQDMAGRYGGEEFLVVLPETGSENARRLADRLCDRVSSRPIDAGVGDLVPLSISVGVAVFPDNGATRDELVRAADRALYVAKQSGRNRVSSAVGPA